MTTPRSRFREQRGATTIEVRMPDSGMRRLRPASFLLAMMFASGTSVVFAAVLQVGPTRTYTTVRSAAQSARDGDTVEIDSGIYSRDVATWRAGNLTIRGVGPTRPHMRSDGLTEGGKAIWVMQGANCTVEFMEFSGASVPDHNGAGIRAETTGTLTIRNCDFHDNEDGILGPNDSAASLVVENTVFRGNGYGDGFSHNIYVGRIASFRMTGSYSHHARNGHTVKSRARANYILYSRIMDEVDGSASYEIDLPEGGRAVLIGNIVQKGARAENNSMVSYAAENTNAGVLELYAVNNTFVNEDPNPGTDATFLRMRQGTKATIVNNIMAGPGSPWTTDGVTVAQSHNYIDSSGNNTARLADPAAYDYHLLADSPCRDAGVLPDPAGGESLTPQYEYVYDSHSAARVAAGTIDIGAFEYRDATVGLSYFPQVVLGGGYTTVFRITNVGATAATGALSLTEDSGNPAGGGLSSFPVSIPPGGTSSLVAADAGASGARKGWAKLEGSGGLLSGAATFQLRSGTKLVDTVGVLGTTPTASATIPVDNSEAQSRYVGFAIANPNAFAMNITLTVVDERGQPVETFAPAELNPLGAGRQIARFLHEYHQSRATFRGSLRLRSPDEHQFVAVALVLDRGRYTAIPVAAGTHP